MTETLCTSGSVKLKAGSDVSTALTGAQYTEMIQQAEGELIADTRVNWITHWPIISGSNFAKIIEGAVAAKAAVTAVSYSLAAYASLNYAITTINVNLDEYDRAVSKLKDANVFKPFGGTAITE